ncbi:MAG TPA: TonB-dependent receptor, partial [Phenylobacterium sp.]|nr:TonB-dependent receptor [Phenylobacterium sp.]
GSYEFERGSWLLTGGTDLAVNDTLKLRISGQTSADRGWVHNVVTDHYTPRTKDSAIRGVLVWNPTADLDVTALVQHDLSHNKGSPVEQIASTGVPELLAALAGHPGVIEDRLDRSNALTSPSLGGEQIERLAVDKYAVTANWTLASHTLTSITAYSRYTDRNIADSDMLPGDYLQRAVDESSHQFSQEVRLVSPADKPFTYIVGGLYLDGRLKNFTTLVANYPFGPAPGVNLTGTERTDFDQKNDAESLFAQGDYKLTDALRLTAGVRWTREKKTADLDRVVLKPGLVSVVIFPPYAPFSLEHTERNLDYSFGAQYAVTSDAMLYASYGKGTKSGGFAQSVTRLETAPYHKEIAKTAEAGLKLQAPDRTWVFNAAVFDTRVDGFQLVTFNGIQFVVGNTDLSSRGFEVESYWYPVHGLRLFFNNTYAEAKDRHTKKPIPLAPKWTGAVGFSYRGDAFRELVWKADGSVDYRSKRYYQQDPATSPPGKAFTTLNLGLAIGARDDGWEARLIGRNLTDEIASAFAFPTPLLPAGNQNAIAERGRTIALQISLKR